MSTIATGNELMEALAALFAFDDEPSRGYGQSPGQNIIQFAQAADASTTTTVAEYAIGAMKNVGYADGQRQTFLRSKVLAIVLLADGSTTASTVYKTDIITAYDSAGANSTVVANISTSSTGAGGTGNISKWVPLIIDPNNATTKMTNPIIPAGGFLTFQRTTSTTTSVAIPRTVYTLLLEPY